jgi:hypothetical protein
MRCGLDVNRETVEYGHVSREPRDQNYFAGEAQPTDRHASHNLSVRSVTNINVSLCRIS